MPREKSRQNDEPQASSSGGARRRLTPAQPAGARAPPAQTRKPAYSDKHRPARKTARTESTSDESAEEMEDDESTVHSSDCEVQSVESEEHQAISDDSSEDEMTKPDSPPDSDDDAPLVRRVEPAPQPETSDDEDDKPLVRRPRRNLSPEVFRLIDAVDAALPKVLVEYLPLPGEFIPLIHIREEVTVETEPQKKTESTKASEASNLKPKNDSNLKQDRKHDFKLDEDVGPRDEANQNQKLSEVLSDKVLKIPEKWIDLKKSTQGPLEKGEKYPKKQADEKPMEPQQEPPAKRVKESE